MKPKISKSTAIFIALTLLSILTTACNRRVSNFDQTFSPNPISAVGASRNTLTYAQLTGGFESPSPVDNAALAIPLQASPPAHVFEGSLELLNESSNGNFLLLNGRPNATATIQHLPDFDFEFVQSDGHLIPTQRGLIITDHPYWNYILEPGRVWQEDSDQGFSRASFPFALVRKGHNAAVNGVMTFVFDDDEISKVWYQITQETYSSLTADIWGLLDANYQSHPVADSTQIQNAFDQELADRIPVKPIEQLAEDYPEVDLSAFGNGVTPENMTWYGFVINGVNYVGGCQTRYGLYPYCESMRAPSYSTAKSAFVSLAMMRLTQKYGITVPELLIKDYLPEAEIGFSDWSTVTFNNTLDMATGNYRSPIHMIDELRFITDPIWFGSSSDQIIAEAFLWPSSEPPGNRWVYHTSDTIILTAAMQNYLKSVEGPDSDIFQFVVDEIYKPLNMSPGGFTTLRTRDNNWQGNPYGGLGLWWIPDDLAKIGSLLIVDDGEIDGEQILHPELLAATLQQSPNDRGVDRGRNEKYNNAFWASPYSPSDGYDCEFWVTQMQGFSGILVALFPNGSIYYYASDNRDFTWDAALRETDKIIPLCQF